MIAIRHALIVTGATCLAVFANSSANAQTVERTIAAVKTDGGTLAGKMLPSGVKVWLGIPFAKPPTQNLRWQPPQPMSWSGAWNADRLMPECIQVLRPHNINHYFGEEPTSENCLYMNVWAPANARANSKLPVVVFMYGGGSTIGSSGMASYSGENVAKHGAVFVNFNYRVGLLGFMAHPELSSEQGGHSGNYAYLDQNAALKWIQKNIAKFGGDPARVLISGQSAGAGSVVQQIFSPLSKGLFSSALMSSGCNFTGADTTLAAGEAIGLEAQKRLGAANLEAMRNVPADKILALQSEFQVGTSVEGLRVGGVIDGYFMPKPRAQIMAAHEMNVVPIIASFNMDESSSELMNATTVADYQAAATRLYGDKAAELQNLYPVSSPADIKRVGGTVAREQGLESNARSCAQLHDSVNQSPAFIDTFARKHPYTPGVKIADQDPATIGAYHTADIPYWFGTLDSLNLFRPTRDWTPLDRSLSEKMMGSLIAFARTGNPATADVQWPAWKPGDERKVEFGDQISVVKLNTAGLDFLKANPAKVPTNSAAPRGARD
jgi:para-nitrobenzyl esterase